MTTFNFNDQNFLTFKTRENQEIDLTEYYDLIYQHKNDCLIAGMKYNKTFYKDRDLEPSEDFMFSIKLIPLTAVEQKFANQLDVFKKKIKNIFYIIIINTLLSNFECY